MKYLPKLVLLTLFVKFSACVPKQNQPIEATDYVPKLVKVQSEIRTAMKPFNDSISFFGDTSVFFSHLQPVMFGTDKAIGDLSNLAPASRQDSLVFAAASRLNTNYQNLIHLGYRDLFEIYNIGALSDSMENKADSILRSYLYEDSLAVNYFNSLLGSNIQKLNYF
ncbi:MAG: hypothetical protein RLZZ337_1664 [Bacteroidota bacterium]|jgi:hypothetical protein